MNTASERCFRIDHHVHTSRHSPDSRIAPAQLIEQARKAGLDAVVITEHDYQWEPDELADLNELAGELLVLSGAEVSAYEGHFLVYGLPDLDEAEPGIPLADLLQLVERHKAAIVAAHPFRWEQDFQEIVNEHGPAFHALELVSNNVTLETRRLTEQLLARYPMGATGSSDGHSPEVVGCYHTRFNRPIHSMSDFVRSLHERTGRPGHCQGMRLTSGPVDA